MANYFLRKETKTIETRYLNIPCTFSNINFTQLPKLVTTSVFFDFTFVYRINILLSW